MSEKMQWGGDSDRFPGSVMAEDVVAWVNANGGEARYENHWEGDRDRGSGNRLNRIAIRTINGLAYAAPGDTIVMGEEEFEDDRPNIGDVCENCATLVKERWSGIACDCGYTWFCY